MYYVPTLTSAHISFRRCSRVIIRVGRNLEISIFEEVVLLIWQFKIIKGGGNIIGRGELLWDGAVALPLHAAGRQEIGAGFSVLKGY